MAQLLLFIQIRFGITPAILMYWNRLFNNTSFAENQWSNIESRQQVPLRVSNPFISKGLQKLRSDDSIRSIEALLVYRIIIQCFGMHTNQLILDLKNWVSCAHYGAGLVDAVSKSSKKPFFKLC
jgi:hypothetical protein